jgi:hypothetical protein
VSDPVARRQGSWSECVRVLRPLVRSTAARSARRIGLALSRARWALLVALAAGTAVWLVMPAVVRRTLGGDCRLFVELVGVHDDGRGNLVLDRDSCPLTHPEVQAVWLVALVVAMLAGLLTLRLMGGRR